MPASGRGANLDTSRRVGTPKPPPRRIPTPPPVINLRSTALPQQPFKPAQQQAQHHVEQAQRALPQQPTPHIPRLPNPTPQQTQAALALAKQHAKGNPNYWKELHNDPRPQSREYLRTIEHYTKAFKQQNRSALTGSSSVAKAYAPQDIGLPLLGLANIKIPGTGKLAAGLGHTLASLTPGLQSATPETKFFKSIPSDIAAIGTFPVVAGYKTAESAVQAAKGNTKPGEQFIKGTVEGLKHGAVGSAVQGDWKGLETAFKEHPLLSLAEIEGGRTAAFRAGGAVARGISKPGAGVRGKLADSPIVNRVRNPVALTNEPAQARQGYVRQRTHSGDPGRAAIQKLFNGETMVDAKGKTVTTYDRGKQRPVSVPKTSMLPKFPDQAQQFQERRANFTTTRKQGMERAARHEAATQSLVAKTRPGGKGPAGLQFALRPANKGRLRPMKIDTQRTPMTRANLERVAATGFTSGLFRSPKTFAGDLARRINTISAEVKGNNFRHEEERVAAEHNLAMLQRISEDRHLTSPAGIKRSYNLGIRQAKILNEADAKLTDQQIFDQAKAHRGRLTEYALAHMNATHFTEKGHKEAEQAARDAGLSRAEQIAVSGRDPQGVIAHENAHAVKGAALDTMKKANAKVAGLERRLAAKKGAAKRTPLPEDAKAIRELETKLSATRAESKAAKRAHNEAVQAIRENPLPPVREALRTREGKILTNEAIEAHAKAAGRHPDTLAYLPHRLEATSNRSFHKRFDVQKRPSDNTQARTGHLFERGANSISHELPHDELTHKATTLIQTQQIDKTIHESAILHPALEKARSGEDLTPKEKTIVDNHHGRFTVKEASEFADRHNAAHADKPGEELIPVRLHAAKLPKAMREAVHEKQSPTGMEATQLGLLNDRLDVSQEGSQARNVGLMSRAEFNQLARHLDPPGEIQRFAQMAVGPFRMAVLPQPKWLTGNFLEPYVVRLPFYGSGAILPGLAVDLRATKRMMNLLKKGSEADKQLHAELQTQFGGLFIGNRGSALHRTYEDFTGKTRAGLWYAHQVRNAPVLKTIGDMILAIPLTFFAVNRVIEGTAQRAAFGHVLREEMQAASGSYLKAVAAMKPALEEAKNGLVNTATQHRFMEAQYEMLGQYDGWSPAMKRLMLGWTPFLPWTLSAMRFVYWTLPAHHTATWSLMMKASQSVMPQWEAEHKDAPPGELKWDLKVGPKAYKNVVRSTPFGATIPISEAITSGDSTQLAQYSSQFLPELSGIKEALGGRNFLGKPLEVPKASGRGKGKADAGDVLKVVGKSLVESSVPLAGLINTIASGGGTQYATSLPWDVKTKPNTKHESGLSRALNPIRTINLKKGGPGTHAKTAPKSEVERATQALQAYETAPSAKGAEEERALKALQEYEKAR